MTRPWVSQLERTHMTGAYFAHQAVAKAIRHGLLPPIQGRMCTDCGEPAIHYDHRDYNHPLQVEPVCRVCNYARGPAVHIDKVA